MPDPLPPTVAIEPTGYFVPGAGVYSPHDVARFPNVGAIALYRRDDIAPLRVPLVDQHNNVMGHENRKARELLIERVWTDKDGVVWSRPTAFAYAAVCEARHLADMELGEVRGLLAALVDEIGEDDGFYLRGPAGVKAEAYLNRSRNIDTPKEPTE